MPSIANRHLLSGARAPWATLFRCGMFLVLVSAVCSARAESYQATIRWTTHGIPHIVADDWPSIAYGQGYVQGRLNACIVADQLVKIRGQRAEFFGPGEDNEHVESDFRYKALDVYRFAKQGFPQLSARAQAMLKGYAAGYNRALATADSEGLDTRCAGADWVGPISAIDVTANGIDLGILLGSQLMPATYFSQALPPGAPKPDQANAELPPLEFFLSRGAASNGAAFGRDMTAGRRGLLLSNNHLPWEGENRGYECHLTIPGKLNVTGLTIFGIYAVQMGFNEDVAWTHTASNAKHLAIYRLKLVDGDPTSYVYDNGVRKMEHQDAIVRVKQPDGSLKDVTRRLYRSHHGPVVTMPNVPWTKKTAYVLKDANIDSLSSFELWPKLNQATGVEEFKAALGRYGTPWAHTMYTDKEGTVFYADASSVPNLNDKALAGFLKSVEKDFFVRTLWQQYRQVLLDGSNSLYEWSNAGTPRPGLVPLEEAPHFIRADFCANSNDTSWMTNPAEPLEVRSPFFGTPRQPISLRTRMGLTLFTETGPDSARGEDERFTFEELKDALFGNRVLSADLVRDDLVARAKSAGSVTVKVDGETRAVDLAQAAKTLETWDGRTNLDSRGAALIREFMAHSRWTSKPKLHRVPFNPDDPVGTPRGLAEAEDGKTDPALEALAQAVLSLEKAGFGPDVSMRDIQYSAPAGDRIGLHGGQEREGAYNIVTYFSPPLGGTDLLPRMLRPEMVNSRSALTAEGYLVNAGPNYVMLVEFREDGPHGEALLAHSQSSDPQSPHFNDQLALYVNKELRPVLFRDADIEKDPNLRIEKISSNDD